MCSPQPIPAHTRKDNTVKTNKRWCFKKVKIYLKVGFSLKCGQNIPQKSICHLNPSHTSFVLSANNSTPSGLNFQHAFTRCTMSQCCMKLTEQMDRDPIRSHVISGSQPACPRLFSSDGFSFHYFYKDITVKLNKLI